MSKYSLQAVRQKFKESHPEYEEWTEFTINDGDKRIYRFHHPLFQTNEEKRALKRAQASGDDEQMVEALLGHDEYADFIENGGQTSDVLLLVATIQETMNGVDEQGNPTTR